ncbi:MAG TPA: type I DNA topoisomerase [bacterium]|nr:type I DNA topoisomerase [bacterium]HOL49765.1 type I DNA topoisomerase [bacterium]HPO51536.1 type I DNA topoisomerase [bacterium]HXK44306.1 type I DNA topoisomerase [bacterium]
MSKKLVIVESPAKARTIGYMLGSDYIVRATLGHIMDLPENNFGVDLESFTPEYIILPGKKKVVSYLKKLAANSEAIYIATDEDREGEAIAWHTASVLDKSIEDVERVAFHEITKPAVLESFQKPRKIDMNLVSAQQTRRILDRIVGYTLSPLLGRNLSAGRVQSVALQLIVTREKEIQNFIPQPYWVIKVVVDCRGKLFKMQLVSVDNEKIQSPGITDKEKVAQYITDIKNSQQIIVSDVSRITKNTGPYPPFITSSLQQEASTKLGFASSKTMFVAQQLYEGVPIEKKTPVGLITYMRTDSPSVSKIAQHQAAKFIQETFGNEYVPDRPPYYAARVSNAQEAHEAIRPTHINFTPDHLKKHLTRDQFLLYKMIWERFIASQMKPAVVETLTIKANTGKYEFEAFKSKVVFDGFTKLWNIKIDAGEENIPDDISEATVLELKNTEAEEKKTNPPPRYTEASLIRTLEKFGIGRPSTYAPTVSTLVKRKYVRKEKKVFVPEKLGVVVSETLSKYFPDVINVQFTAEMEKQLDEIAEGKKDGVVILKEFYGNFKPSLDKATAEMDTEIKTIREEKNSPGPVEKIEKNCPKCGKPLIIRISRYGKFIGCTGFPKCRHTEKIKNNDHHPSY